MQKLRVQMEEKRAKVKTKVRVHFLACIANKDESLGISEVRTSFFISKDEVPPFGNKVKTSEPDTNKSPKNLNCLSRNVTFKRKGFSIILNNNVEINCNCIHFVQR